MNSNIIFPKNTKGFTLVEVIVSIAILGIVMASITSFFLSSNKMSILGSDQRDVQSNVRLAMDQVLQDIRYATEVTVLADMTGQDTSSTVYGYVFFDNATGELKHSIIDNGTPTGNLRTMPGEFSDFVFNKVGGFPENISVSIDAQEGNQDYPLDSTINFPNITLLKQSVSGINSGLAIKYKPATSSAIAVIPIGPPVSVIGVTIAPTTLNISVGETAQLTATVQPSKASNKNVVWSINDSSIASVSNGQVTGIKTGVATVTVTTVDGGKTASCVVTVNPPAVYVTSVTVSPTSETLLVGQTAQLTATIAPANATNKAVTWSSSNTNYVTVDANGLITAVKKNGNATITVRTVDGGKTSSCNVKVDNK